MEIKIQNSSQGIYASKACYGSRIHHLCAESRSGTKLTSKAASNECLSLTDQWWAVCFFPGVSKSSSAPVGTVSLRVEYYRKGFMSRRFWQDLGSTVEELNTFPQTVEVKHKSCQELLMFHIQNCDSPQREYWTRASWALHHHTLHPSLMKTSSGFCNL